MGAHSGPADWWTEGTDKGRTHVATKGIVTDGLVLNLDASVSASYPGAGTTWYDLSGNGNNGTLINGVGYTINNKGTLIFDGVDDYTSLSNNLLDLSGDWTVDVWVKVNNDSNPRIFTMITAADNLTVGYMQNTLVPYIRIDNSAVSGTTSITVSQWYNITYQVSSTIKKIFINSNEIEITSGGITANALYSAIGGGYNNYQFNGELASGKVYTRALTQIEIQQNFNALKNRFGL